MRIDTILLSIIFAALVLSILVERDRRSREPHPATIDERIAEYEQRADALESELAGRECAANPWTCSTREIVPGRERRDGLALYEFGPFCSELESRHEERERVARRSLPVLMASEARWKRGRDRAWRCIANIGGTVTATGAIVCVEHFARYACPHEGGSRELSDAELEVLREEGRVW